MPGKLDPLETLDSFVAAFESACKDGSAPDLRVFLPASSHPLRTEVLCELVRVDLEQKWSLGQRCSLEDYRVIVPELFEQPQALAEAAFEEYRQRCLASELVHPDEYAKRYHISTGDWPRPKVFANRKPSNSSIKPPASSQDGSAESEGTEQVAVNLLPRQTSALPSVGDQFLGFEIKRELGRGTFARVFLARQEALADRPVALKVSLNLMGEHKKLARLQHAHIVPIYSIHEHENQQAICMPYFGGFTLDRLTARLKLTATVPAGGIVLTEMLSKNDSALGEAEAGGISARDRFAQMSYSDAIAWIGARLAEGLAHAHDRGLIHRDIKPANILITADGQPMLLDFNISQEVGDSAARAGGSLMYMSPEQMIAYRERVSYAKTTSDLYSLGLVLYELLTGRHPFPFKQNLDPDKINGLLNARRVLPPPISTRNPSVSPTLAAIVQRMVHPDPTRRHATAEQVREDLDAHLADRPLPHTKVQSRRERTRKWLRRHPRLMIAVATAVVVSLFVLAPATAMAVRRQQVARAEALNLYAQSRTEIQTADYYLTVREDEPRHRQLGLRLGRDILNRYGVLAETQRTPELKSERLPPEDRKQLTREIGELMVLMAQAEDRDGQPETQETALRLNVRAGDFLGDDIPKWSWDQRQRLLNVLGHRVEAEQLRQRSFPRSNLSDLDRLMEAQSLIAVTRFRDALVLLDAITQHNPSHYQAWEAAGHCHFHLGDNNDAIACFSVCLALRPDSPWANYNRGMLFVRTGNFPRAIADLNRALELKPDFADALLDRAIAKQKLGDLDGAEADLTLALKSDNAPSRIYFRRAAVLRMAGKNKEADADWNEGLKNPPVEDQDRIERGLAQVDTNPKASLADFEAVLATNPRNRDALHNKVFVLGERLNRTEDAIKSLDRFLELYPDSLEALGSRGVYHARLGHVKEARSDAVECYRRDHSPAGLYQQASLFGMLAARDPVAKDDAVRLLAESLQAGFDNFKLIETDTDMSPVRKDPEFVRLIATARDLHRAPPDRHP